MTHNDGSARQNITFRIDKNVKVKIDLLLRHPTTGKIPHGAFANLVNHLLADWAARELRKRNRPTKGDDL